MANFISISTAETYPLVKQAYRRIGAFRAAALADFAGSKTWTRKPPGLGDVSARAIQVDIQAIPGVVALKRGGRPR